MELRPEDLPRYVGGQAEVQNTKQGYLLRGEVKSAKVNEDILVLDFDWLAKGEGFPPLPAKGWVMTEPREYRISLDFYAVSDIGNGRVCLDSPIFNETTVLFPKGDNNLDRSKVRDT